MLINLIANALKFSPGGQVDVTVQMTGARNLRVDIADDGIGMSEAQQASLFQPFTQATEEISERFGGTGLGLSITQRLVHALGGEISVRSESGVGSTFSVDFPVEPIGERKSLTRPAIRKQSGTKSGPSQSAETTPRALALDAKALDAKVLDAKVLIADDVRDIRYVAEHFLKKAGCTVQIVENGRQAVDAIVQANSDGNPFELVPMDMQMPVLSGDGAVKELREQGIDIPVIALTADAMKGTRRRLLQLGFDDYMSKPLDPKQLIRVAAALLTRND